MQFIPWNYDKYIEYENSYVVPVYYNDDKIEIEKIILSFEWILFSWRWYKKLVNDKKVILLKKIKLGTFLRIWNIKL